MQLASNSQNKAIFHGSGPMLVMAGPGSGKTFVMIERVLYLIREKKVAPDKILVISFSKASANELKERFCKSYKQLSPIPHFSTFHAYFFQLLREAYHYRIEDIIKEQEKKNILFTVLSDPLYKVKSSDESLRSKEEMEERIRELLSKISFYKNRGIREMEQKEDLSFCTIYHAYNRLMHQNHLLDFDDFGLLCFTMLKKDQNLLERFRERFSYILIDEFQDINTIQFNTIKLLADGHKNLFAVGDDDQAIYSFRGASPKYMLQFTHYYPMAKTVLLETNYRCSKAIVEESLKVIEENKYRLKKEISASSKEEGYVVYSSFSHTAKENKYIADRIEDYRKKGGKDKDIACIYRTNSRMFPLVQELSKRNIPFTMKEQTESIFRHPIAKDIIHYLDFIFRGKKRKDFLPIMNKPVRFISRNALQKEVISVNDLQLYYTSNQQMKRILEELEQLIRWMERLDLYGAVHYLRRVGKYDEYLKDYCRRRELNYQEQEEILSFIHESTRGIESLEEWEDKIREMENMVKNNKNKDGIQLTTMHACKGLEYEYVFLPDCNEGIIPHHKAVCEEEIEEERRMFYVAMTRAKKKLEILWIEGEDRKSYQKSRFITFAKKNEPRSCQV